MFFIELAHCRDDLGSDQISNTDAVLLTKVRSEVPGVEIVWGQISHR